MAMVGRERPLHLYGPPDLKGFVETNLEYLRLEPPYPLQVTTIEGDGPIRVVDEPGYRVWAHPNHHSAPGFAYLLEEKPRPGVFNPQRARELGVPEGPLWHFLQHGKPVKVGGRLVKPEEVVGPRRRGRRVGFSGDTRPIEALAEFFKGCDVLVYDSTYGEAHRDKALEYLHSTAREAGELAFRAGVRLLVLTHFSTRYDDPEVLVAEARQVHPNVIAAHELLSIDVPYPE
jgi:ribonuclease Z